MQIGQYTGIGTLVSGHKFIVENAAANANNYYTFGSLTGQLNNSYYLKSNPNNFAQSGELYSTGSILNDRIVSLSGYSNSTFATVINVGTTGSTLQGNINTLTDNLTTTGLSIPVIKVTGSNAILSLNFTGVGGTNVYLSGASLVCISGGGGGSAPDLSSYATIVNLGSTGSTLDSKINTLSGFSTGQFATIINLASTGSQAWNAANNNGTNLSGSLQSTGSNLYNLITGLSGQSNLNYYTKNNESGFLNTLSGLSTGYVQTISGVLNDKINLIASSAGGVSSLGGVSGIIDLVGQGNISISTGALTITISGNTGYLVGYATVNNLYTTGSNLNNNIVGLSGVVNGVITNLGSTGSMIVGLSGVVNSVILNLGTTGSNAHANALNLSGNLTTTGVTLNAKIVSLSGWAASSASLSSYATVADVTTTGVTLGAKVDSLSGWSASATNLTTTGKTLYDNITAFSGNVQSNAVNLSGNLTTTGATLIAKVDSLSGYSYPKSNPANYASSGNFISGVSITGGNAIQGACNINAGSNISLIQQTTNSFSIGISSNYPQLYIGSGDPEGVVSAISGSLYTDYFNVTLYQKITGAAAYGWQ